MEGVVLIRGDTRCSPQDYIYEVYKYFKVNTEPVQCPVRNIEVLDINMNPVFVYQNLLKIDDTSTRIKSG